MPYFTCPSCGSHLTVTLAATEKRPARPSSQNTIGAGDLRDVFDLMTRLGPGRRKTDDLFSQFEQSHPLNRMTKNGFARALRMNGATPWRGAEGRGWDLPKLEQDQRPAVPAPTVREKTDREAYQAALGAHTGGTWAKGRGVPPGNVNVADILKRRGITLTGDTTDLPFEMELEETP